MRKKYYKNVHYDVHCGIAATLKLELETWLCFMFRNKTL